MVHGSWFIVNRMIRTNKQNKQIKYKRGQVLIIAIIFLAVFIILSTGIFSRVTSFIIFGSNTSLKEQALSVAEGGVDYAVWQLNETVGSFTGANNVAIGTTGTANITITNKNASLKTITSTAYIPNSTNPRAKRTIKVDAVIGSQSIAFNYAVQVGTGGVNMANSSTITGSVYSNGSISGSGPSSIDGDAYAVGTISNPPSVGGTYNPNSPPSVMPVVDYNFWKTAANINNDAITCAPTCTITSNQNIGPKKYNGNLTLANGAIVTMQGPIHVTGNFSISNLSGLNLDNSFGSTGTTLIVDGTVTVQNNGHFNPTNANPKGYILVVSTSTANPAISIANNGASAIFYALDGGARLQNSAQVNALVAKSLTLQNSATLNYDAGLASAQFSSGPGGSWDIKKGTYRYTNSP